MYVFVLTKQASPTMSRYQNPSERSLKHALLVELLLKLRRGEVKLQVLPSPSLLTRLRASHALLHLQVTTSYRCIPYCLSFF